MSPPLKRAYDLIQSFLRMVHKREGKRLDAWLAKVAESGLPELQSFAAGVEKDKDAVKAGLTWPINNGMVEGHVTKLKLIKRTMYGRAGFALLRQRVLHAVEKNRKSCFPTFTPSEGGTLPPLHHAPRKIRCLRRSS